MASKITPATRAAMTRRIVKAYRSASDADRAHGARWYVDAHALALEFRPDDVRAGAGVIAALSPRMTWAGNVKAARAAAAGRPFGGLPDNVRKARAILTGADPLDVLGGSKVRAFYACIVTAGQTDAVCVDMHAHDIAIGRVSDNSTRGILATIGGYAAIAEAYRSAARILSRDGVAVTPCEVQAATWVWWRRTTYREHASQLRRPNARKAA